MIFLANRQDHAISYVLHLIPKRFYFFTLALIFFVLYLHCFKTGTPVVKTKALTWLLKNVQLYYPLLGRDLDFGLEWALLVLTYLQQWEVVGGVTANEARRTGMLTFRFIFILDPLCLVQELLPRGNESRLLSSLGQVKWWNFSTKFWSNADPADGCWQGFYFLFFFFWACLIKP